jgi:heme-degrading monooxygenase HmoA
MAIVIRARVSGMTRAIYDQMSEGMMPQIKKQAGFIAHAGCPIPGGWEVVEIWESQEQFDAWLKGIVMPAASAAGMAPSSVKIQQATRVVTK